jgi:hypothetical protein
VQESTDNQLPGGKISSYFDHQYPTYCGPPNSNGCTPNDLRAVNFYGYDGGNLSSNQPPYNVTYNGHDGIDFSLEHSTKVLAAATGKVIVAESAKENINDGDDSDNCFGSYVVIEHANGYKTIYVHLSETKGTDPNTSTLLTSPGNDVFAWFPSNISSVPLRVELAETLQPTYINGLPALRSFFVMAYEDDISPLSSLNNVFYIYYQPQINISEKPTGNSPIKPDNYQVFLWNKITGSWSEIPMEYDSVNNFIISTSTKLGTFIVVDQNNIFLPLVIRP